MTEAKRGKPHDLVRGEAFYEGLDPGIRFAVRVLHAATIETGQSCQGGDGHAYDRPTVDLWEDDNTTGFAALHYLAECGLPVRDIARLWDIDFRSGLPTAPFWRITFYQSMEERAEDLPSFVRSTQSQWVEEG